MMEGVSLPWLSHLSDLRGSLVPLLRLATPVIAAELGWMSMGIVDTLMVSPLGPAALGAVGIGSMLFMAVGIFGMGLLLGLDTMVSQAFGAGDERACKDWLVAGLWLAVLACVPLAGVLWLLLASLGRLGLHPAVAPLVYDYLWIVCLSLPPLLLYAAVRRYLQGMSRVGPIAFALVSANVINIAVNWVLIEGRLGVPALGVQGAAIATVVSRLYLFVVLAAVSRWLWVSRRAHLRPRARDAGGRLGEPSLPWTRIRQLTSLGLPAAAHLLFEVGIFTAATALAGRLAPDSLAAHHIALNIASVIFMVPLGVASAGAVLVGQGVGRRDGPAAARAGWTALLVVVAIMLTSALAMWSWPAMWIGLFTDDGAVIAIGSPLLLVAAAFQLFDGLQVTATGVLRGLGETRWPMLSSLLGYWGVGLPLGYWLCFSAGYGVIGLWMGLAASLMVVGTALVWLWDRRVRQTVASLRVQAVPA
jgi:MATE family multidrug resistance protein